MLVSVTSGVVNPPSTTLTLWERFDALDEATRDLLTSPEISLMIKKIQNHYRLDDQSIEDLSRLTRMYFFKDLRQPDFINQISLITGSTQEESIEIVSHMETIVPTPYTDALQTSSQRVSISLTQALEELPVLAKHRITQTALTSQNGSTLSPTVANWIALYDKTLDVTHHNTMGRGEFLYRAPACRNLTEDERERLGELFRAYDEGTPLTIDTEKGEIVWSQETLTKAPLTQKATNPKPAVPNPPQPQTQKTSSRETASPQKRHASIKRSDRTASHEVESGRVATQAPQRHKRPLQHAQKLHPSQITQTQTPQQTPQSPIKNATPNASLQKFGNAQTQKKSASSEVSFSSGHTLPGEKGSSAQNPPSRKTPYNMKPIDRS